MVGDADELLDKVVGSGQRTETNFVLTRTRKMRKNKAVLSLCMVKRKLLKEYDTYKLNKYNIINHV